MNGYTRKIEFWEVNCNEDAIEFLEKRREETYAAIGYLSTWAYHDKKIKLVRISFSHKGSKWEPELTATYFDDTMAPSFTMGAVWREVEKKFSYHS